MKYYTTLKQQKPGLVDDDSTMRKNICRSARQVSLSVLEIEVVIESWTVISAA